MKRIGWMAMALMAGCSADGGGDSAATDATVQAESVALEIQWDGRADRGRSETFEAIATYGDGRSEDVTAQVEWVSSDPETFAIDAQGKAEAHFGGPVTVTASLGEVSASVDFAVECPYPSSRGQLALGQTVPPLMWRDAFAADGSTFDFNLRDVHCGKAYADAKTVVFVLGAGWCGACTAFIHRLNVDAVALEAAGARIVYLEYEDAQSMPAGNDYAQSHVSRQIGTGPGVRVGDADTRCVAGEDVPCPEFVANANIIRSLPTVIVARTSDMRLIADSNTTPYPLPLFEITADPDADWTNPNVPEFVAQCEAADEEPGEPNDTAAQATRLTVGTHEGGVCAEGPDFYRIDVQGVWRLDMTFDSAEGDLDLHVWDTAEDKPLLVNGEPVGSVTNGSTEGFLYEGPATVQVNGYNNSSAAYSITLKAL